MCQQKNLPALEFFQDYCALVGQLYAITMNSQLLDDLYTGVHANIIYTINGHIQAHPYKTENTIVTFKTTLAHHTGDFFRVLFRWATEFLFLNEQKPIDPTKSIKFIAKEVRDLLLTIHFTPATSATNRARSHGLSVQPLLDQLQKLCSEKGLNHQYIQSTCNTIVSTIAQLIVRSLADSCRLEQTGELTQANIKKLHARLHRDIASKVNDLLSKSSGTKSNMYLRFLFIDNLDSNKIQELASKQLNLMLEQPGSQLAKIAFPLTQRVLGTMASNKNFSEFTEARAANKQRLHHSAASAAAFLAGMGEHKGPTDQNDASQPDSSEAKSATP